MLLPINRYAINITAKYDDYFHLGCVIRYLALPAERAMEMKLTQASKLFYPFHKC